MQKIQHLQMKTNIKTLKSNLKKCFNSNMRIYEYFCICGRRERARLFCYLCGLQDVKVSSYLEKMLRHMWLFRWHRLSFSILT